MYVGIRIVLSRVIVVAVGSHLIRFIFFFSFRFSSMFRARLISSPTDWNSCLSASHITMLWFLVYFFFYVWCFRLLCYILIYAASRRDPWLWWMARLIRIFQSTRKWRRQMVDGQIMAKLNSSTIRRNCFSVIINYLMVFLVFTVFNRICARFCRIRKVVKKKHVTCGRSILIIIERVQRVLCISAAKTKSKYKMFGNGWHTRIAYINTHDKTHTNKEKRNAGCPWSNNYNHTFYRNNKHLTSSAAQFVVVCASELWQRKCT